MPDAAPPLSAWSDGARKDADMVALCVWVRQALPSAELPCCCGPAFVCLTCRVTDIVERYLPGQPDPAA